ncbi:MAG TPA: hypothetical protein VGP99_11290 [Tepidisphaeraceae bacterium]|nr:hypothetical protein [Tepidisphaeraceae bacterium]
MRFVWFCVCASLVALTINRATVAAEQYELWLYYPTNFQPKESIAKLEPIWRRAAKAGYTKILLPDSKFAKLGDLGGMEKQYFGNVEKAKKLAEELKLELVPAMFDIGYSNNLLWHDPNLAEGLPVKDSLFVVKNGEARLVADPPVSFGKPTWVDEVVKISDGVATLEDFEANARINYKLKVSSFRCYHVSAFIKTEEFSGDPHITVLAGKRSLQHQNLGVKRTQDWTEHHVVFNSLENSEVNVYLGVWGGGTGKLQWKDWKIEEVGLLNVLRRPGTPCVVKGYVEGKDYDPIVDPLMGSKPWKGEYTSWHQPPAIKTKLPDGTQLRVSWYHPAIIYDGQVSCCPSEPATIELLADQARRVKEAFGTKAYMMSHDEIRTWNWDEACMKRNMDAGEILAVNVRQCTKLLEGSRVYVWSDMFDPFHNAHGDYYLVRGDFKGSWEGLDPSVTILNWNFGKRDQSLKFFAEWGHKQIIAGYYDAPVGQVKKWLEAAKKVKGVEGVMYTTWKGNYRDVEEFARVVRG